MKLSQVQEILETEVLFRNGSLRKDVRSFFARGLINEMILCVNIPLFATKHLTFKYRYPLLLYNFKDNTKAMDTTYAG